MKHGLWTIAALALLIGTGNRAAADFIPAVTGGQATSTYLSLSGNNGYQTVQSLTVTTDSAKTGLYDLNASGIISGAYYSDARYLVDGTPVGPFFYQGNSINGYPQSLSAPYQLNLSPGTHTIALQVYDYGSNPYIIDPTIQATGYNLLPELAPSVAAPEPSTITLLAIGIVCLTGYGWRRRKLAAT